MNYKVICNFFLNHVSVHGTRQNDSFYITHFHTNAKSMCISIYGGRLWYSLNGNITTCRTIQVLKKLKVRYYCNVLATIYLAMILNCYMS